MSVRKSTEMIGRHNLEIISIESAPDSFGNSQIAISLSGDGICGNSVESLRLSAAELSSKFSGVVCLPDRIDETDFGIILKYQGVRSLAEGQISILDIGIDISEALHELHSRGYYHGELSHLLVGCEENGQGFCLLYTFNLPVAGLVEKLPYIAPELIGGDFYGAGASSDLFSLGVLLYMSATACFPFDSLKPEEAVYAHFAKPVRPPSEINPGLPTQISDIICRLLEKNPEKRYRTAWGLRHDLLKYRQQLFEGKTSQFLCGKADRLPFISMEEVFFGRESETARLKQALISRNPKDFSIIRISGKPGTGKTRLIKNIFPCVQQSSELFVSISCGRNEKNLPYCTISALIRKIVRKYLKKPAADLELFRTLFNERLSESGDVLLSIEPELMLLTGELVEVEPLGPDESLNRIIESFTRLLEIFFESSGNLSVIIDDIQWIDEQSLELLTAGIHRLRLVPELLVIIIFRQDAWDSRQLSPAIIDQVNYHSILSIDLGPLSFPSVNSFLSEILFRDTEDTAGLCEELMRRSGGNPFFLRVLIEKMQNEGLLVFDFQNQNWRWSLESIRSYPVSDSVVELLVTEMKKLNNDLLRILSVASCLDSEFSSALLSVFLNKSDCFIETQLEILAVRGFIYRIKADSDKFKFVHDKIQKAAYSIHRGAERIKLHLEIARALDGRRTEREKDLLKIVYHYNKAASLIESAEDILHIIRLNMKAALQAREQSVWGLYSQLAREAMRFYNLKLVEFDYNEKLQLYRFGIESSRLISDYREMDRLIEESVTEVFDSVDRIGLLKERIPALMAQNRMREACETADLMLDFLGKRRNFLNYFRLINLKNKGYQFFSNLNLITDFRIEAGIEVLMLSFSARYLSNPKALKNFVFCCLGLSFRFGKSVYLPFFLLMYSLVLQKKSRQLNTSARVGRLGMYIGKETQNRRVLTRINFLYGGFVQHLSEPLNKCILTLNKAEEQGLGIGDFEYATLAKNMSLFLTFAGGRNLESILEGEQEHFLFISRFDFGRSRKTAERTFGIVANLCGKTEDKYSIVSSGTDEFILRESLDAGDYSGTASYYTYKMMLHYYYDDLETAGVYSDKAVGCLQGLLGQFTYVLYIWFSSLLILKKEQKRLTVNEKSLVTKNIKILKLYADQAAANYKHRYYLVSAEYARMEKREQEAAWFYQSAIDAAAVNGFIQDQALACELAGSFYLEAGKTAAAKIFLNMAGDCYKAWGARRKLEQLKGKYPFLQGRIESAERASSITEKIARIIDVSSIMAAAQAISGEINHDDLIKTILKTVIKSSGARRGVLIDYQSGRSRASALAEVINDELRINIYQSNDVPVAGLFLQEVTDYCINSSAAVILDGRRDSELLSINEMEKRSIRSLLCIPLILRNTVTGCLYLENELVAGLFSAEKLEILNYLSGQIAVSLENARLYHSLQKSYQSLREQKEQNEKQTEQLIESEKFASLGILAASITHEVSNPNYAIHLNADFLSSCKNELLAHLDEIDDEDLQVGGLPYPEFSKKLPLVTETILSCSEQIDSVIKDLKRYARKEPEEKREPLDINSVISDSVRLCRDFIEKSTDNFELKLTELPSVVNVQRKKMQQVLINLIINACQALGGRECLLRLESDVDTERSIVKILVIDQGCGMIASKELLAEAFYSTKGGLGLGLSISEEILKIYNGKLDFFKNDYNGTTVVVSLPAVKEEGLI